MNNQARLRESWVKTKPDYEEATPSEVEAIPTKQLLALRNECYRLRGSDGAGDESRDENGVLVDAGKYAVYRFQNGTRPNPYYNPNKPPDGQNQKNLPTSRSVMIFMKDILYELNRRPHVPNKKEAYQKRHTHSKQR